MILDFFVRKRRLAQHRNALGDLAIHLPLLQGLSAAQRERLVELALYVLGNKAFSPVDGETLDDESAGVIALQLALPALELGRAALDGWHELVLYPDAFISRDQWMDHGGLVHEGEEVLVGQARLDGPVLLSRPDAVHAAQLDGWNVVIHELAHKLDMMDGGANGCPPLHKGMNRETWAADWSAAYHAFCRDVDAGFEGWLDPYASENPAEFFAVLSEYFFEAPHWVAEDYPAVYRQLAAFYRQDPAARLPRLPIEALLPPAA